jgi:hypothetical protein
MSLIWERLRIGCSVIEFDVDRSRAVGARSEDDERKIGTNMARSLSERGLRREDCSG